MSYMRIAKLFVPAGALLHASCGDTFCPGQGQISVEPGRHGRFGSSATKLTGMRAPSWIDDDVSVKNEAARLPDVAAIIATLKNRPHLRIACPRCMETTAVRLPIALSREPVHAAGHVELRHEEIAARIDRDAVR